MKISKRQLRQIIKEAILTEASEHDTYNALYQNLDAWARTNMTKSDLISGLRQQAKVRLNLQGADYQTIKEVVADWIIENGGEP